MSSSTGQPGHVLMVIVDVPNHLEMKRYEGYVSE